MRKMESISHQFHINLSNRLIPAESVPEHGVEFGSDSRGERRAIRQFALNMYFQWLYNRRAARRKTKEIVYRKL